MVWPLYYPAHPLLTTRRHIQGILGSTDLQEQSLGTLGAHIGDTLDVEGSASLDIRTLDCSSTSELGQVSRTGFSLP